jgi:hypothetical protein
MRMCICRAFYFANGKVYEGEWSDNARNGMGIEREVVYMYIDTCMHTYVYVCTYTYVHAYMRIYTHACIRT